MTVLLNGEVSGQLNPAHATRQHRPGTPARTFPTLPAAEAPGEVVWVFDVFVFFTRQTLSGAVWLFAVLCNVSACEKEELEKRRVTTERRMEVSLQKASWFPCQQS